MSTRFSLEDVGIESVERCLVCGCPDHELIFEARDTLHGLPGVWAVRQCRECGHGFTSPRPDRASIGLYYHDEYSPFHSPAAREAPSGLEGWLKGLLHPLLDPRETILPRSLTTGRALEVGCGSGRFLVELGGKGWQVQGLEPSALAVDNAARKGEIEVTRGTVETVDFPASSFDLVVGLMVLEHLHDPVADTRKIATWLRPGGSFMGSVPNCRSWEFRAFGPNWYALQVPTHLSHFTPRSLSRMLVDAGFEPPRIIGQRNISNLMIHLGRALERRGWSCGKIFLDYPVHGPRILRWMTWPVAFLLAAIGQAGRITFVAHKPVSSD